MPKGKKKNHPCAGWCEGELNGIVENLRLRGEVEPDFHVDFIPAFAFTRVPPNTFTLTCTHGRTWMIKEPKPATV